MEPTSSSCLFCARPLTAGSVSNVCPECIRTLQLQEPFGETLRPAATVGPRVHLHFTRDADGEVPLPPNPPGLALLRRLGTGGMGTVYLAVDAHTRRLVAVKLLHSPGDRSSVDRFQSEVRALAELNHPHIVTVFTADLSHHVPYYTMEYVAGGTLARHVRSKGRLPPRTAAELLLTLARAAHAAHERGIVHRDIKPGNVLLLPASEQTEETTPRAKLSDFGLVKRTDRNDGLTVGTVAVGTPGFMAPEQANNGPITPRTDVYGLGATLYHALTGQAPFPGGAAESLARMRQSEAPRVRSLRPEVPVKLEAIVHKCLEKAPTARYSSAAELAADLERFLAEKPVQAKSLTPTRRAVRTIRQNRHRLARIALALAALVLAVLGGAAISNRPRSEQVQHPPTALEAMQAKLSAGETVTLVGMTGEPHWHRWVQGPSGFAPAGNRDHACAFQSLGVGMLELCPDPMTDRYRIRAEVCQLGVVGRTPDGQLPAGGTHDFGVYFGRQTVIGNDGWRAENCLAVRFSEVVKASGVEQARFGRAYLVESPTRPTSLSGVGLASAPLVQSRGLPGPWRVIEVEVTPQGVKAWIGSLDGAPIAFPEQNAAVIGRTYAAPSAALDSKEPGHGLVFPAWKPQAPLGIWNHRSTMAVRNVTLTPLP